MLFFVLFANINSKKNASSDLADILSYNWVAVNHSLLVAEDLSE